MLLNVDQEDEECRSTNLSKTYHELPFKIIFTVRNTYFNIKLSLNYCNFKFMYYF